MDEDAKLLEEAKAERVGRKVTPTSSISSIYGLSDKWYIQRKVNPAAQYQYAYVLLDTNNIATDLSTDTQFGWRFLNFVSLVTGNVNCVSNIRDLVGMRIFPVTMQLVAPVAEAGKVYINPLTNINNNFTVLIHEFQAQSFIGRDGRKFHFDLFPALMNPTLDVSLNPFITPADPYFEFTTSGKGNGWFWFRKPIVSFDTLTISIGNPFDLIKPDNNTRTLIPIQFVYLSEKKEDP